MVSSRIGFGPQVESAVLLVAPVAVGLAIDYSSVRSSPPCAPARPPPPPPPPPSPSPPPQPNAPARASAVPLTPPPAVPLTPPPAVLCRSLPHPLCAHPNGRQAPPWRSARCAWQLASPVLCCCRVRRPRHRDVPRNGRVGLRLSGLCNGRLCVLVCHDDGHYSCVNRTTLSVSIRSRLHFGALQ